MTDTERKPYGKRAVRETRLEDASEAAAKAEIETENQNAEAKHRKKREAQQVEAEKQVAKFLDPGSTRKQKELARKQINKLAGTLAGRELFRKVLESFGLGAVTYAEMVAISAEVGQKGSDEAVGEKTALEARKHVTSSLERVHDIDRKQEETSPVINIIIGDPFREASDAADTRNTGHTVGPPQWSDSSPEEPE